MRIAICHQNKPDSTLKSVNWFLGNCLDFLPFPCPKQLFIWCSGTELIWERIRNSKLLTVVTGVSQCDSWLSPSRISLTNSIAPVNRVKVNTGSSSGLMCMSPLPALVGPRGYSTFQDPDRATSLPAVGTGYGQQHSTHLADLKLAFSYHWPCTIILFCCFFPFPPNRDMKTKVSS